MEDMDSTAVLKEKLLAAGIDEILSHGVKGFSLRRVAAACGASCAAPYKHFKNKDELIKEIISYVEEKWEHLAEQICEAFEEPKECIGELCTANVRFKISNPIYGMGENSFDKQISVRVENYCAEMGYPDANERLFAVAALVCGTAALMESGKVENSPENFEILREKVIRELM